MKTTKSISALFILSALINLSCSHDKRNELLTPAYRMNLIDSLFNYAVSNHEIPGAVVYIKRDGKVVFHKAYVTEIWKIKFLCAKTIFFAWLQ